MSDATTPNTRPPEQPDLIEVTLRLSAASRLLAHGDRARRLGIDPERKALHLVRQAALWLPSH